MIIFKLFITFFKIGMVAFGGGYGALSIIQDEIVNVNKWIGIEEFLDLISISQMTPGPIAINSATFIGYNIAGFWGSVASTIGVITPSIIWIVVILKLLKLLSKKIDTDLIFKSLRIAIIGLIIAATLNIGFGSIVSTFHIVLGIIGFIILLKFKLSVIWIILLSGIAGIFGKLINLI